MANVGTIDRGIRVLIGLAAIAAVFIGPFAGAGWERFALGAAAIELRVAIICKSKAAVKLNGAVGCKR